MLTGLFSEKQQGSLAWLCIKLSFIWFWIREMLNMLISGGDCIYPVGVCKWYSFDILFSSPGVWVFAPIITGCVVLYLFEKQMLLVTGVLTLISCIIISHHESTGIFLRATPYTTIFAAQFFAYLFARLNPDFNLALYRQQYPVQIIAATYTISSIAKLSESGLAWVDNGAHLFALPVIKSFCFLYFDTGNPAALEKGYAIANFALQHQSLFKLLLGGSLLLETCCLVVVLNSRLRFGYGVALALMHLGIKLSMNILIGGLAYPMLIFFINPLYLLLLAYQNRPAFLRKRATVAG